MCIDVDRYPSPFFIRWAFGESKTALFGTSPSPAQLRRIPMGTGLVAPLIVFLLGGGAGDISGD
jgi:hypothetical protein